MSTTNQIIAGTFVVLILAWILVKSDAFQTVVQSVGGVFVQGVGALAPKQ